MIHLNEIDWITNNNYIQANINNKFFIDIWKFGNIYQCKVNVNYDHKIDNKSISNDNVGVCLKPANNVLDAKINCINWINDYKNLYSLPDILIDNSLKKYPSLFPNRIAVIDQYFFVIGCGYFWLDGALYSHPDEEDSIESSEIFEKQNEKEDEEFFNLISNAFDILNISKENFSKEKILLKIESAKFQIKLDRKKMWEGDKFLFHPVSKNHSNIFKVPDDVKPEWLYLAYEAALLLRDNSGIPEFNSNYFAFSDNDLKNQEKNRELGSLIVEDLERRFYHVKKISSQKEK